VILVIDNYDSFTYNLVHLLAREGAEVEVRRNRDLSVEQVRQMEPEGILISPGPGRPEGAGISMPLIRELGAEIPILGVCLGHQALAEVFGGKVVHAPTLMHGKTSRIRHDGRGVFEGLPQDFVATRYHSLTVDPESIPEVLEPTAWSEDGVLMGLRHRTLPLEGVQFHPESVLTVEGPRLVGNWMRKVVAGDGCQVPGAGFRVPGAGCQVPGEPDKAQVPGAGYGVPGAGYGVPGAACQVPGEPPILTLR
jgi:anthranilate synthase component II